MREEEEILKKVIICNVPMREYVAKTVYTSNDLSLPVSKQAFRYPVLSFLSQTLTSGDELKVFLLVKKDGNEFYEKNTENFRSEMSDVLSFTGASAEYVIIDTAFSQDKETHEQLMVSLAEAIDVDSHIIADITYGPKDLPIVIFSVLTFAENFLHCEIENIIYGQVEFANNIVVGSKICDMSPLYYMSSVSNTIKCDDPVKAKQILKSLLTL